MINFDLIKNQKLRQLLMISESINTLPEDEIQKVVEQMTYLPQAQQEDMIQVFEEEQAKISAIKKAKGITPEIEMAQFQEKKAKIHAIKYRFENIVRKENEKTEVASSEEAAQKILTKL